MKQFLTYILALISLSGFSQSAVPTVINSGGGSGVDGNLNNWQYSIGETVTFTGGPSPVVTNGFNQPLAGCVAPLVVTLDTDNDPLGDGSGECGDLRHAIYWANNNSVTSGVPDEITFAIPTGPYRIGLSSELPPITDELIIRGRSQNAAIGATSDSLNANHGIQIIINNASLNADYGLNIRSNNVTVRGLSIVNFRQAGIYAENVQDVVIEGCFLGIEPDGTEGPNGIGIHLNTVLATDASNFSSRLGGGSAKDINVISGNDNDGVLLEKCDGIGIIRNFIGLDPLLTTTIPNKGDGINLKDSRNIQIGADVSGAFNYIAGNGSTDLNHQIFIEGNSNDITITHNKIGLLADNTTIPSVGDGINSDASGEIFVGSSKIKFSNLIAGGNHGIVAASNPSTILIQKNAIFGNSNEGIFNSNDPLPSPITTIVVEGTDTLIKGTANSGVTLIQVYADLDDEGQVYLGDAVLSGSDWELKFTKAMLDRMNLVLGSATTKYLTYTESYMPPSNHRTSQFSAPFEFINPCKPIDISTNSYVINPTCYGNDGAIVIKGLTDLQDYNFSYNTIDASLVSGSATADVDSIVFASLVAGTYTNIYVDSAGCSSDTILSFDLVDPKLPTFTSSVTNPSCAGATDGIITLSELDDAFIYTVNYTDDIGTISLNTNPIGGEILLSGLKGITYTNISVDSLGCTSNGLSLTLTDLDGPMVNDLTDVISCDQFILPAITGSNLTGNEAYYTASGGTQTQYTPGEIITLDQTVFIYDSITTAPMCNSEESFVVTINQSPTITAYGINPTTEGGNDGAIVIKGVIDSETYDVYDAGGKLLTDVKPVGDSIVIHNFPAGTYTGIYVVDKGGVCSSNLIASVTLSEPGAVYDIPQITCVQADSDEAFISWSDEGVASYSLIYTTDTNSVSPFVLSVAGTSTIITSLNNGSIYYMAVTYPGADTSAWHTVYPVERAGRAIELDATSQNYIEIPQGTVSAALASNNSSRTIEAWIKPAGGQMMIFQQGGTTASTKFLIRTNTSNNVYLDIQGKSAIWLNAIPQDGEWHHIALVYAGDLNNSYLMVDEGPSKSPDSADNGDLAGVIDSDIWIGKGWYSSTDQYTTGQIDEVRIWKTARTAEQVLANLYQPLKGDTGANLLAVYHFDELEGDTAYNSVCGAEHGVWMGTPKPMSVVSGAMIKSLAAPSSVCAQPGNGQVDISWDAVAEAASGYEVIYGTDSIMVTDSQPVPSGTIATITGLTNNSLYYFAVVSVGGDTSTFTAVIPVLEAGGAISLNGSDQNVVVTNSTMFDFSGSEDYTLEAWINIPISGIGIKKIIEKWAGGVNRLHYGFSYNYNNETFSFTYNDFNSGGGNAPTITITKGEWIHVAGVKNGATTTLYVNGLQLSQIVQTQLDAQKSLGDLYIGSGSGGEYFGGQIDEVRIWNRALLQSEIDSLKDVSLLGNETGLVGLWHFDEPSGDITYDASCNGNHGTLINNPVSVPSRAMHPFSDTLVAQGNAAGDSIFLAWNTNLATDIVEYHVYQSQTATLDTTGLTPDFVVTAPDTMLKIGGFVNCDTLWYFVYGVDAVGQVGKGFYVDSAVVCPPPILATTSLCAQPSNGQVSLSWEDVSAPNGYEVIYGTDSISTTGSVLVAGIETTITGLTNNSLYYFAVVSVGGDTSDFTGAVPVIEAGGAAKVNNSNYIIISDIGFPTEDNPRTIEFWFKPEVVNSDIQTLFSYGRSAQQRRFRISFQEGKMSWDIFGGTRRVLEDVELDVDEWYHFAITYSGGSTADNSVYYINGEPYSEANGDTFSGHDNVLDTKLSFNGEAGIGFDPTVTPYPFQGEIDEVRIWDYVRSPSEINENKDKVLSSPVSGLVGYWRLDEGSSTVVYDASCNGNHGVWNGTPTVVPSRAMHPFTDTLVAQGNAVGDSIFLTWNTNVAKDVAEYHVYQSQTATLDTTGLTPDFVVTAPDTMLKIGGFVNCDTLWYFVYGVDAAGQVGEGFYVDSAVVCPPPILATTSLCAQPSNAQVSLSWDDAGAPNGYEVIYGTDSTSTTGSLLVAGTDTTITGLTNNSLYYFAVVSVGGDTSNFTGAVPVVEAGRAISAISSRARIRKRILGGLSNYTITAWINSSENGSQRTIYGEGGQVVTLFRIENGGANNGKLSLQVLDSDWTRTYSSNLVPNNEWVFVAATVTSDGSTSTVNFYVNDEVTTVTTSGSMIPRNSGNVTIGAIPNNASFDYLNGDLDELSIWDKVLSDNEIFAIRDKNIRADEQTGLLALYHLDESIGNGIAYDASCNENHATWEGTPTFIESKAMHPFKPTGLAVTANILSWTTPNIATDVVSYTILKKGSTTWDSVGTADPTLPNFDLTPSCVNELYKVYAIDAAGQKGVISDSIVVAPSNTLNDGLVVNLSFDSDLSDASGNANDASASFTPTYVSDELTNPSSAVLLNGTGMNIANNASLSSASGHSMALWINITPGTTGVNALFSKGSDSQGYHAWLATDPANQGFHRVVYYGRGGSNGSGQTGIFGGSIEEGKWHHIVFTNDNAGKLQAYINGVLTNEIFGEPVILDMGDNLNIGSAGGTLYGFDGAFNDFRMYNRVITAAEVSQLARSVLPDSILACSLPQDIVATAIAGATYTWQKPDGTNLNTQTISADVVGQYDVTVTDGGCIQITDMVEVVSPNLSTTLIYSDTLINGTDTLATTATLSGDTIKWYKIGLMDTLMFADTAAFVVLTPGKYFFTRTNGVCTVSSDTVEFNVYVCNQLQVTSTDDGPNAGTTCGTLRYAIGYANLTSGRDTITFDFRLLGADPYRINIETALPEITEEIVIDGWSEPSWVKTPVVEINGGGLADRGLHIGATAPTSEVRGLSIGGFQYNKGGIYVEGNNTWLYGNYIGIDVAEAAFGNENGIKLDGSGVTVGTNGDGTNDVLERNIIGNNLYNGIHISGSNHIIKGNFIGVSSDGVTPIPHNNAGIDLNAASNITIGGINPFEWNLVSNNIETQLLLSGSVDLIKVVSNYFNTDSTGKEILGDTAILIRNSDVFQNTIGGTTITEANFIGGDVKASKNTFANIWNINHFFGDIVFDQATNTQFQVNAPVITGFDYNTLTVTGTADPNKNVYLYADSIGSAPHYITEISLGNTSNWSHTFTQVEFDNLIALGLDSLTALKDSVGNSSRFSNHVSIVPCNLTVDLGADISMVCSSDTILDAGIVGSEVSYKWTASSIATLTTQTIIVTAADTYVLEVDSAGCIATDSIVINAFTELSVTVPDVFDCVVSTFLNASDYITGTPTQYRWDPIDGLLGSVLSTSIFTSTENGSWSLSIADANCSVVDTFDLQLGGITLDMNDVDTCLTSITLDAGIPSATYVWTDLSGNQSSGASQTYLVSQSGSYRLDVTLSGGCSDSDTVNVTFNGFEITANVIQHQTDMINPDGQADYTSLTPLVGTPSVVWLDDLDNQIATVDVVTGLVAGDYRVVVTDDNCTDTSNVITITSSSTPLTPGAISADQNICSGALPMAFTSVSAATGGVGTLVYEWQQSTDGLAWTAATGSTDSETYSAGALTQTTYFRRSVTDGTTTVFTDSVVVTVSAGPLDNITVSATVATLCSGSDATINLSTSETGVDYQLLVNNSLVGVPTTSTGGTMDLTVPASELTAEGDYEVSVNATLGTCQSVVLSDTAGFTVSSSAAPVITKSADLCASANTVLSAAPDVTGNTYQWYIDGYLLAKGTEAQVTAYIEGDYYVDITSASGCSGTSNVITVTYDTKAVNPTFTKEGSALKATQTGAGYTYQWYVDYQGKVLAIVGATGASYIPIYSGDYYLSINTGISTCTRISAPINVTGSSTINIARVSLSTTATSIYIPVESISSTIQVIPNPALEDFDVVYTSGSTGTMFLSIIDMNGVEVISEQLYKEGFTATVHVSDLDHELNAGVYLIKIVDGGAVYFEKVMIE